MSDNPDSDETLLPDDADRKIEELMSALRESEQEMMGVARSGEEAEGTAPGDMPEAEDDFLSDGEGDFVDLDAELLDNSADKLTLDEDEWLDEPLLDEVAAGPESAVVEEFAAEDDLAAAEEFAAESEFTAGDEFAGPADDSFRREAEELARARLDELEQKLAAVETISLHVPAPAARKGGGLSGWITSTLALAALAVGGAALWLNYNSPSTTSPVEVAGESATPQLQALKADLAALRERMSVVEKQAEQGGEEAVQMLERMQLMLARMEEKISDRAMQGDGGAATPAMESTEAVPPVAEPAPAPLEAAEKLAEEEPQPVASEPPPSSSPPSAAQKEGKLFVRGWAVNLRSYYHRTDAERLMQRYQKAGIDAQIREIPKGKVTWYRVRVMGFESKQEANAFIEGLSEEQGRDTAWPSYYQGYIDG